MNADSLIEKAYTIIRHKILSSEYMPGSLLSIYKLADQLEMSRTPIASAISRLELEGLVVTLKNRGVIVKEISSKECLDILEVMHCHRMHTLDLVEGSDHYAFNLHELGTCLEQIVIQKERNDYPKYVARSLAFIRTFIAASNNHVMLQIMDAHHDKIALSSITSYKLNPQLKYYSGGYFYSSLYEALVDHNYAKAREILTEHYTKIRERIIVSGSFKI